MTLVDSFKGRCRQLHVDSLLLVACKENKECQTGCGQSNAKLSAQYIFRLHCSQKSDQVFEVRGFDEAPVSLG